eukprot:9069188-Lingulodinium_polyedra.AAC.1
MARWVERRELPEVWHHLRQAHVPKPGCQPRPDGAVSDKDLRPISAASTWWRVAIAAIAHGPEAAGW